MKKENRGGVPLAGLTMAAILLASTVGYVSALSRMFQAPMIAEESEGFLSDGDTSAPAARMPEVSIEQGLGRMAAAWLMNALPGYSSGRARELWYLSLDSSGDRRLSFETSSVTNSSASGTYAVFNPSLFNNLAPAVSGFVGSKTTSPNLAAAATSLFWDADGATTTNTGGTGNWNGGSTWRLTTSTGTLQAWVNGSDATLGGLAGTITINTSSVSGDNLFVTTPGYAITSSARTRTLTFNTLSLDPGVGLTLEINSGTGAATWSLGTITSGAGSLLTLKGGASVANADILSITTETTVSVDTAIVQSAGGASGAAIGYNLSVTGAAIGSPKAGTINSNVTNNSGALFLLGANQFNTLTYGGKITGTGGVEFSSNHNGGGAGTIILNSNTSDYSGRTVINNSVQGIIRLGIDNALPSGTALQFGNGGANNVGTLDLNGHNLTVGSLATNISGAGVANGITNTNGATLSTLTINGSTSTSFAGVIGIPTTSVVTNASNNIALTKAGTGTLTLSGANTYTGDTTIAGGELFLSPVGSLSSSSTIRLGGTAANSPSAMFTFGSTSGGITLSNPMIVQASASGTEGTRTLLGLATSGNTNTYSGTVTMNTDLLVQSAAVGSTVANGQGTLLFQGASIDVKDNIFMMNSNLRGNNADTYSIQGIVRVNEVLGSSLTTGGSVVKDGSGTLILQGTSNTYTGTDASDLNTSGTTIRAGILGIFGDGSLGLAPSTATNNVFFNSSAFNTNTDSIGPTLRADAAGITLAATRNINIASGVTGRFDSNGNTFTIAGNINGAGNLNKVGPGNSRAHGSEYLHGHDNH